VLEGNTQLSGVERQVQESVYPAPALRPWTMMSQATQIIPEGAQEESHRSAAFQTGGMAEALGTLPTQRHFLTREFVANFHTGLGRRRRPIMNFDEWKTAWDRNRGLSCDRLMLLFLWGCTDCNVFSSRRHAMWTTWKL
jgi:hypothetical protein